jgi:hypothetical protein
MLKKPAALLLALLLCASCAGLAHPTATPTPAPQDTAVDYAVYKALIETMYTDPNIGMVVIQDRTTSGLPPIGSDDKVFEVIQKALPEVDQAMRDNYLARNTQSALLEDRFNLKVPVTLLNQADFDSFFGKSGKGWDDFYFQYPKSQGVLTLSRVGFNAPGDKALVCAGTQAYTLAGAGYAVVLSLENGLWKVVNQVMLWTS